VEAVWQGLYGNAAAARKNATAALADSNGRDIEYAAGLALGFAGDVARTEGLAADLEKRFPEDTFARFTYVPVLRGLAAVSQNQPTGSLEQPQSAIPYELAVNGPDINLCCSSLTFGPRRDLIHSFFFALEERNVVPEDQVARCFQFAGGGLLERPLGIIETIEEEIGVFQISVPEYGIGANGDILLCLFDHSFPAPWGDSFQKRYQYRNHPLVSAR
jgi:hypothetical protein